MTTLQFKGPAAYVGDLERSRAFYESVLGLRVARVMRSGERDIAVAYAAGFSVWEKAHAYWSIFGDAALAPESLRAGTWENTFETPEFEAVYERCEAAGVEFLYKIKELPWGQRGFRAYDPDGHIVDISETHGALVRRLFAGGMPTDAIGRQISLSEAEVDAHLRSETD